MAYLRIMTGPQKGQKYEIDRDEMVIGRASENVVVLEDPSVSSRHCAILRSGRRFTLRDLNSTNGTRLNSVTVKEHQLSPKDIVSVGSVDILFDGDDIEPFEPPKAATGPQVTVRIPATSIGSAASAFKAKKDTKLFWIVTLSAVGIIALVMLLVFIVKILSGSAPSPI